MTFKESSERQDLLGLSIHELSVLLRKREVSSREVTQSSLSAIEKLQPILNPFIHVEATAALRQADIADHEISRGEIKGALHGIPLAHKDIFFRKGRRSTCGSKIRENFYPETTASVLERIDAAGAVDLGGLNLAEFCVGPTGHNDYFGHCRNPWNLEYVSGGSSSGSGCAVAARLVYGSIGSDTGGSIRLPAGMCGVVGLKPTHGRVSLYGAMPRCWSLDVFGPLTRTVRDAAILFDAISGFDIRDPWSRVVGPQSCVEKLKRNIKGQRIGVPENVIYSQLPSNLKVVHDQALEEFQGLGVEIVSVKIPDPEELYRWTTIINRVEASSIHKEWILNRRDDYNISTIARIADGFTITAIDYIDALERRDKANIAFDEKVFNQCDVLYCPLLLIDIPTIVETDIRNEASASRIVHHVTQATRWVSFVGLPALALPIGFSPAGLPVSAQLIGPRFREHRLLTLGDAYQRVTSWHNINPPNSSLNL